VSWQFHVAIHPHYAENYRPDLAVMSISVLDSTHLLHRVRIYRERVFPFTIGNKARHEEAEIVDGTDVHPVIAEIESWYGEPRGFGRQREVALGPA
jgi:hypothetical protein